MSKQNRSYLATVPAQEILPLINSRFESSVRGIFVVGDVTGLPLVKIAANQGRQVMDRLKEDGYFRRSATEDGLDLVIVGGGPAGISAAIEAEKLGIKYVLLERSKAASTVRSFPPGKKVYAEPKSMPSDSELDVSEDFDKDEFLSMVSKAINDNKIKLKEEVEVTKVRKVGEENFMVDTKEGTSFPTRLVLIAVGRQGQPRLLQAPGADMAHKVTHRFHTAEDYKDKNVLVVGGGNSAIEAALMLCDHNRVTISYRGGEFYRAKEENRALIEAAIKQGRLDAIYNSNVTEVREGEVDLKVGDDMQTIPNDNVIVQIGTLPPIDFLHDMGLELDGVWTTKRFAWSFIGLAVGIFIYFFAKNFVLRAEAASGHKIFIPGLESVAATGWLDWLHMLITYILPIPWLLLLGLNIANYNLKARGKIPFLRIPGLSWMLGISLCVFIACQTFPSFMTLSPAEAGKGPYYFPGFSWMYNFVPEYFTNAYGFYYLLYFSLIAVFGIYWAVRINNKILWRRNLTIIATQWTLWWGIPTFLVVFMGTNPWTPLIQRSINAWPLNMAAFSVDQSVVRPGDPGWWHTVAVIGVVWAVFLTFVFIPLFTIKFGKIYCSYICSCGALAETVGNSFRHRGPKGDLPRKWEKVGFVFIVLAVIATVADLMGFKGLLGFYNVWVGTLLSGAIAIGMYPFLGQRIWCRMWCPLAFWMNFWGRWSKFKITPEKGKCIDCNVCNQYCQMGIDIKTRALQGVPVTLKDTPCVGCAECVMRCPMQILHLGEAPNGKPLHSIKLEK